MAVGKEAPIPDIVAAAAACRAALEETVAQFSETFASIPLTTIKRRLKDAVIVMPNGLTHTEVVECKDEKPCKDTITVEKLL
jgi:hypothetical protein